MLLQNLVKIISETSPTMIANNGESTGSTYSITTMLNNYRAGDPFSNAHTQGGNGVHMFVCVGKSDTEPAFTDYTLGSEATELTYVSASATKDLNGIVYSVSCTFKNETANAVIIKEIGMGFHMNQNSNGRIYFAKSVLDTPVTMNAGDIYTFSYTIEV